MAPTLMAWVAVRALLAHTGCWIIAATQKTKSGAVGNVPVYGQRLRIGNGRRLGCKEPAWLPLLIANYA